MLHDWVRMIKSQDSSDGGTGTSLDVVSDILRHSFKWSEEGSNEDLCNVFFTYYPDLLDVDRRHVLQDPGPEGVPLVGHRAVLHRPVEHHHVAGLALDLDHVGVEVRLIVRVPGHVVGVRPERRPSVVFGEVCEEGDELHGHWRRRVHDVRVCRRIKCPEKGTGC